MTDADYRGCAAGHVAMGTCVLPDGRRSAVNVEQMGGNVLVQHYVEELAEAGRVRLVSEASDCFSAFARLALRVTWELEIEPATATTSVLHCRTMTETDSKVAALAGKYLAARMLNQHTEEECAAFARDIERKFGN